MQKTAKHAERVTHTIPDHPGQATASQTTDGAICNHYQEKSGLRPEPHDDEHPNKLRAPQAPRYAKTLLVLSARTPTQTRTQRQTT